MKLKRLEIDSFRSLRHVVWEPGDLNILIGPNAGGKSNLLKALEFLAMAGRGCLGDYVQRQGGADSIVWDGSREIVKFLISVGQDASQQLGSDPSYQLTYELQLRPSSQFSEFRVLKEWLSYDGDGAPPVLLERMLERAIIYGDDSSRNAIPEKALKPHETLLSLAANPMVGSAWMGDLWNDVSRWIVYQDIHTDSKAEVRRPPVSRSERTLEPDGQNVANVLHTHYTNDPNFEQDLNDAMSAAFGDEFVKLVFTPGGGDQRIELKVRWKSLKRQSPATELSDGTLRFLCLLAILLNPELPPLIAIDEPEAGLHPSMLSIVAETAAAAAERTQVILSTHSSEFLDAFSAVSVKPTIHVVECHEGQTQIKPVVGDRLAHWLKEYKLGELYRTKQLEAML